MRATYRIPKTLAFNVIPKATTSSFFLVLVFAIGGGIFVAIFWTYVAAVTAKA